MPLIKYSKVLFQHLVIYFIYTVSNGTKSGSSIQLQNVNFQRGKWGGCAYESIFIQILTYMDNSRLENSSPKKVLDMCLEKQSAIKRKGNRHEELRLKLHIKITPQEYNEEGMHLLGNFKQITARDQGNHLQDHRVALLSPSLFRNKTVLDVGCGQGKIAVEIAMRYFPLKMVALDIDSKLVSGVNKLVHRIIKKNQLYANRSQIQVHKAQDLPKYFRDKFMDKINSEKKITKVQIIPEQQQFLTSFPDNFYTINQNFINMTIDQPFDTIILMRTTKWMHLAFGDQGLTALLEKVYDALVVDGILVIQFPQYDSYKKRRKMNSLYTENMKTHIHMLPNSFPFILKEMGFQMVSEVVGDEQHYLKHPLMILRKKNHEQMCVE